MKAIWGRIFIIMVCDMNHQATRRYCMLSPLFDRAYQRIAQTPQLLASNLEGAHKRLEDKEFSP